MQGWGNVSDDAEMSPQQDAMHMPISSKRVAGDQSVTFPVSGMPHLFRLKASEHRQEKDPLTGLTTVEEFAEQRLWSQEH